MLSVYAEKLKQVMIDKSFDMVIDVTSMCVAIFKETKHIWLQSNHYAKTGKMAKKLPLWAKEVS